MSTTIHTEKDAQGLELALRELFEESYIAGATGSILSRVDAAARQRIEDDMPERTLSPGYYSRAAYLLDLASALDRGATYMAASLMRDDVRGLEALKRAQADFEREHFACPACGTRQPNAFMIQCFQCKAKFAGRAD